MKKLALVVAVMLMLAAVLCVTGVLIWARKRRARVQQQVQAAPANRFRPDLAT